MCANGQKNQQRADTSSWIKKEPVFPIMKTGVNACSFLEPKKQKYPSRKDSKLWEHLSGKRLLMSTNMLLRLQNALFHSLSLLWLPCQVRQHGLSILIFAATFKHDRIKKRKEKKLVVIGYEAIT